MKELKFITLKLPVNQYPKLKALAKEEFRSVPNYLLALIENLLKEKGKNEK